MQYTACLTDSITDNLHSQSATDSQPYPYVNIIAFKRIFFGSLNLKNLLFHPCLDSLDGSTGGTNHLKINTFVI